MPIPNSRRWLIPSLLVWLALMGLVWWLGNRGEPVWFDPAREAPHPLHDPANVTRLYQAINEHVTALPGDRPLFIRFSQPDCPCEALVDNYYQLLEPTLRKQGLEPFNFSSKTMEKLVQELGDDLWRWIPSTPAILILTQNRQVAYFGPFHQEGICNSANSYLEPVLEALQQHQQVNIINTLVQGCFCPYPKTRQSPIH